MIFKYLGSGDKSKSCFGKKWVSKTCAEIEALGSLDELNSLLGLVRSQKIPKQFKKILEGVQQNLFIVQADIAAVLFRKKISGIGKEKIAAMEKNINSITERVGELKKFVIPGANDSAAWLDYARAVARRTERKLLAVKKVDENPRIYLNRISSLLFVMARFCAKKKGIKERNPAY